MRPARRINQFYAKIRQEKLFWRSCLLVDVWVIPLVGYAFWHQAYFASWSLFVRASLTLLPITLIANAALKPMAEWVFRRFPEPYQSLRRMGLLGFFFVSFGLAYAKLVMLGLDAVHLYGYRYDPVNGTWILITIAASNAMASGLCEMAYAFFQWRANYLEYQQLEQEQLHAELDEVKQRVNPHFLFNSLNSLSVLIGEDPQQAERFVDEMARVYRYLLQATRSAPAADPNGLTSLDEELRFLQAYGYLLHTRYGQGFDLRVEVDTAVRSQRLPPLSLQTLVDNAIKHNVISVSRPLRIEVRCQSGVLQVSNSLQKRSVRVPLNQAGLAGLMTRYQRLGGEPVQVIADEQRFSVQLPLFNL